MLRKIKINTALLICTVFVFRILFVNISILSSSNISQTNNLLVKYFSTTQKRKRNTEVVVQSNITDYTAVEVCEEDSDDDKDLTKVNLPITLSAFFFFF